ILSAQASVSRTTQISPRAGFRPWEDSQTDFTLRATHSRYAAPETHIAQDAEDSSAAPDLRCTELASGIRKWPRAEETSWYEPPATALSAARPRSPEAGCSLRGSALARQLCKSDADGRSLSQSAGWP